MVMGDELGHVTLSVFTDACQHCAIVNAVTPDFIRHTPQMLSMLPCACAQSITWRRSHLCAFRRPFKVVPGKDDKPMIEGVHLLSS